MDKDPKQQTVAQFLFTQCSESLLAELAANSSYWSDVEKFVENNRNKVIENLSYHQRDWLLKIKIALIEEAGL